jgi:hypothetical protein
MTEADFMRQVTDLATIYGWAWAHFRPAQTVRGWRTPVSGPLGAGFPDLVLVNPNRGALLFVELKRDGAQLRPEQRVVLDLLRSTPALVTVWHPADWPAIEATLRGDA